MNTLEFIDSKSENQQEIMNFIYEFMMSVPGMNTKIRYALPFFDRNEWIMYMNPKKDDSVELCFPRGQHLSNEQGLLDKKDRKMMMGITITNIKDINMDPVIEVINEAIQLDEEDPISVFKLIKKK